MDNIKCNRCNFNNEPGAKFCGKCRLDFSMPFLIQDKGIIKCPCGNETDATNEICPKCGEDLTNPIKSILPNSILSIISVVCIIIAALIIIISIFTLYYLDSVNISSFLMPISLLLIPISVILSIISQIKYKDNLSSTLLKVVLITSIIFLIMFVILLFFKFTLIDPFFDGLCSS